MSLRTLLVASALAAVALAGCSDDPPAGGISDLASAPMLGGAASIDYHAFEGANPAGQIPQVGGQLQCAQPDPVSPVIGPCKPAYTDIRLNLTLPHAGPLVYSVYLENATGELLVAELAAGAMLPNGKDAVYTGAKNFTEDLTGRFTAMELRLGGFIVGHALTTEGGPQMFGLAPGVAPTVTDASYEGMVFQGTVSGLQANASYQGNLYLAGPDGETEAEPAETFTISGDGPFSHTAKRNISEFREFHIHVGASKLNIYKAEIQQPAE